MLNINTVIKKNLQADILSVGVYGEQPDVAMEMTRYYVTMLSKLYTAVNEQTARNNREHLERRYEETILQLNRSEDSLRLFQEKFGVYDIEVQTSTAIKAAAELKSEILLKEVEYGAKQRVYGANSEELRQLASMIQLLNKKEEEMFDGKTSEAATSLFIPFKKTPALGVAYFRLYRNVKIYGELLKVLAPMLEQARLQEKRESPSIVVVDDATRPEKKSRPARSMIVLAVFMGLLSVSFLYILVVEHFAKIKATDEIRYNALVAFFKTPYRDFMAAVGKRKETAVR
jgi:capsule polysaccharide export protein KpsE/RkpR